ncbi:MAG: usg protein [Xanthobacteraceae bacterium]
MTTQDFQKQVEGYGPTTANILYRCPDHPWLLQSYVWQNYDLYPDFPELQSFLEFWQKSLEGVLHSVMVAHSHLIEPVEIKTMDGVFRLR